MLWKSKLILKKKEISITTDPNAKGEWMGERTLNGGRAGIGATCSWRSTRCHRARCRWWWRSGRNWRAPSWWPRCCCRTTATASTLRTRTPSGTCAVHLLPQNRKKKYSVHLHVISIFYNFFFEKYSKIFSWKNYFGSKYQAEKFQKMSIIRVKSRPNFPDFLGFFALILIVLKIHF